MPNNYTYYAVFYIAYPYYIPHFLPISKYLTEQNKKVLYILSDTQNSSLMQKISEDENLDYVFGEEKLYDVNTKFIFFANLFNERKKLNAIKLFLWHGVGTKPYDFEEALRTNDILFVEGRYKYDKLTNEFPQYKSKVKEVGYSKLDSVINIDNDELALLRDKYNIDKNKKTILYAPTFYPSSIEKMSDTFPSDFKDYNIIVKAHYLTFERKRYKKQVQKFDKWEKYDNCIICDVDEYNLVPFLILSDIMISDESAAVFEFAALNKPVILNKFLKLRWSYILNPKKLLKRLDKGMDRYRLIGDNANNYKEMVQLVSENSLNPMKYEKSRLEMSQDICGTVDGSVSQRIFKIMEQL
jgi:CDP-glycerol glycerophosphotransferase (TagB/SpsB family)